MSDSRSESKSPVAREPKGSWDDVAAYEAHLLPDFLLENNYEFLGSEPIECKRYTDPRFFQLEVEKMWPNVWQFAAREEEMLDPGQTVVYENVGRSYVLIRQQDGSVRAFHNVCLHRGRRLCDTSGSLSQIRCRFHGFAWNLDGTLKNVPCPWDFAHLKPQEMRLPEAQVGTWGGYIFIKENPGGPTLEQYLHPLPDHFKRWRHEDCYTAAWAAQVVPANWKACEEAFMESYHVMTTHPQLAPFTGDSQSKTGIWGDHVNATITPFGVPSPQIDARGKDQQWIIDQFLKYNGRVVTPGTSIKVETGETARKAMGSFNRRRLGELAGRDYSQISDSEVQDAFTYNVFPNFSPWGGFAPNVVYRWRPHPDQDHTLMEVRTLARLKPDEQRPPAPPMVMLGPEDSWESVFGQLGVVLMQDMANLPNVQRGMKMSKTGLLQLSNYQEARIRHFHQTLDKYLAR